MTPAYDMRGQACRVGGYFALREMAFVRSQIPPLPVRLRSGLKATLGRNDPGSESGAGRGCGGWFGLGRS